MNNPGQEIPHIEKRVWDSSHGFPSIIYREFLYYIYRENYSAPLGCEASQIPQLKTSLLSKCFLHTLFLAVSPARPSTTWCFLLAQ